MADWRFDLPENEELSISWGGNWDQYTHRLEVYVHGDERWFWEAGCWSWFLHALLRFSTSSQSLVVSSACLLVVLGRLAWSSPSFLWTLCRLVAASPMQRLFISWFICDLLYVCRYEDSKGSFGKLISFGGSGRILSGVNPLVGCWYCTKRTRAETTKST